jgi:hypothetical protein
MASIYLPVACRECQQIRLQPLRAGQESTCQLCGSTGVVLPSPSYSEGDCPLFERIEEGVRSRRLSRQAAERVLRELRDVTRRAQSPEAVLLEVVDQVPSLHFLVPGLQLEGEAAPKRALLTRAAGMLLTIVAARLRQLESNASG